MSGSRSRSKGKRGECEARLLLAERDFDVLDTSDGLAVADIIAERDGKRYAVEVKHCRSIDLDRFWRQAREQAKRHKAHPLLLCRLAGHPHTFLAVRDDAPPSVWSRAWRPNGTDAPAATTDTE